MKIENFSHDVGDIPWNKLDKGIIDVVRALNSAGIPTMGSCDGHGESAWVTTEWQDDPCRVANVLHAFGLRGFTINQRYEFVGLNRCLRFLRIEFWNPIFVPVESQ